ncbi:hypothetical protein CR513_10156, partial [Mucuna pruriens]
MSSKQLATFYNSIFDKFDDNWSNAFVSREMKKILLASVDRLKSFSIQVVLKDDPNSLLHKATGLNTSKI